jgi:hypothetical protein
MRKRGAGLLLKAEREREPGQVAEIICRIAKRERGPG